MRKLLVLLLLLALMTSTGYGAPKGFPEGKITIVTGTSPGGMADLSARVVVPYLEKYFGVPVIVENKPGADFMVGAEYVRSAPKDGRTLFVISTPAGYLSARNLNMKWDFRKEFVPVGTSGFEPYMVSALPSKFNSIQDLLTAAKTRNITFTATGMKSVDTFNTILTTKALGIVDRAVIVSFGSGAEAFAAVQGGHVDVQIRSGGLYLQQERVKLLAVTSSKRVPGIVPGGETSHVPTIEEIAGNKLDIGLMYTTFVHSATPKDRIEKLRDAYKHIYSQPEVIKKLNDAGLAAEPLYGKDMINAIRKLWESVDENYDTVYNILKEKERK